MFLSALLQKQNKRDFLLLERGERVGKKLSATGNGQGNLTNENVGVSHYFSSSDLGLQKIQSVLSSFTKEQTLAFFKELGGLFLSDTRGRVYPTGRQASALTDLLRAFLIKNGAEIQTGSFVKEVQKTKDGFLLTVEKEGKHEEIFAQKLVLCTGGKAAKNFGTDGNGYQLSCALSHTQTALYPSLVQLKTDTEYIKPLKGIRAAGITATAKVLGEEVARFTGDIIFTDYGVSGDAAFFLSAYLTDQKEGTATLCLDLLPSVEQDELEEILRKKRQSGTLANEEILCGILNNQIGRCVVKRAGGDLQKIVSLVKNFPLQVKGTLGFDYAQVTKGGVPLFEVDENLQSKKVKGLYFAGEILDVDGECGGYNLQWAFSSAGVVANAL